MHSILRAAVSTFLVAAFVFLPGSADAQSAERLQVHGFLTQGLGQSGELGVAGLGEHPTWDYRTAALQFGYQISDTERFVLQLGHRRLAHNPLSDVLGDVFVDWAFAQSRLGGTSYRAGKIPMPRGIFNEIRDVGTLLPFYRPALSFYTEGIETIDGVTAARTLALGGAWELDATAFVGSWSFVQVQAEEGEHDEHGAESISAVTQTRAQGATGGQLWLTTPIEGLRLGFGGQRFSMENEGLAGFFGATHGHAGEEGEEEEEEEVHSLPGSLWQVALDGSFDRLTIRGEYQVFALDVVTYYAGYGQVGLRLADRVSVHAQAEFSSVYHAEEEGALWFQHTRDLAASLNFRLTPSTVLKGEGHLRRGHAFDTYVDPTGPSRTGRYFITSVSIAF